MAIERTIHLMGTIIKINIQTALPNDEQVADEAVRRLRHYEKVFSANDDSSDLMQINLQAGKRAVTVPKELFDLIKIGKKYSMNSKGYLNIAIGPLVKLWHIGFQDAHVPSDDKIQKALLLTDPEKIILNEEYRSVMLAEPGMEIDLGALAKGYSADLIKDYLVHSRVQSSVLNLGGNVVVIGGNKLHRDGCWHVGLQDPQQQHLIVIGQRAVKGLFRLSGQACHARYDFSSHGLRNLFYDAGSAGPRFAGKEFAFVQAFDHLRKFHNSKFLKLIRLFLF